jgi:uncharacterized protein YegL
MDYNNFSEYFKVYLMRPMPIYFLVDISESMVGEPVQQFEEDFAKIIQAIKTAVTAIETMGFL